MTIQEIQQLNASTTICAPVKNRQSSTVSWEALGFWRFVLCIIVLSGHALWFDKNPLSWTKFLDTFSGKAAVVGFLLVSGFSIAASIEREKKMFYRRRFLRIYPLYFSALVFAVILELVLGGHLRLPNHTLDSLGLPTTIGNFFLLQTFIVKPIEFDGPVW